MTAGQALLVALAVDEDVLLVAIEHLESAGGSFGDALHEQ